MTSEEDEVWLDRQASEPLLLVFINVNTQVSGVALCAVQVWQLTALTNFTVSL